MLIQIAHSFVNIFAGGRSEIKTLLFIIYLLSIGGLYLVFKKHSFKSLKWSWFGVNLLAMYVYGLALHIYYVLSSGLSLGDFFITGNNSELSSSTLGHTHIAKAVIGQIFSFFGKTQLSNMDAGGAYLGAIPAGVLLLGSVLLFILIVQAILYFVSSYKLLLKNKNRRQKVFLIIGYSIVSFSLIKTSIDGGIFNPSFLLGLVFIGFFILREKGKKINNYYYGAAILALVLIFISLYINSLSNEKSLGLASIASLLLLYTIVLGASEEKMRWQFFAPLLVLFACSWWVSGARDYSIYNYSQARLSLGDKALVYNAQNQGIEVLKLDKQQSIAQLARKLHKNISYYPIAAPGLTCMEKADYLEFSATLISSSHLAPDSLITSEYISVKNEASISQGGNWRTNLSFFINPCLPEVLSAIDGEFRKNNIKNYLLVNPIFYDGSIAR